MKLWELLAIYAVIGTLNVGILIGLIWLIVSVVKYVWLG